MIPVKAYAALKAGAPLAPFRFERREPGPSDILIDILYCGICHSDIHASRGEWDDGRFPMVPGHEIVGRVARMGAKVKGFKPGDMAGVGCYVDSCRTCESCREGLEQYCSDKTTFTYGDLERDGKTPTYGGYSTQITVDQRFVLKIPPGLSPEKAAPLLCAGITTYSPMKHWKMGKGTRLGVLGLGGLGHMAVKLGAALGVEVTVLSSSPEKEKDTRRLGAEDFVLTSNEKQMRNLKGGLDFIIDTVSAPHDLERFLKLLPREGTLVLVGVSPDKLALEPFSIIDGRKRIAGSLIGGIPEIQEMLNFCAKKNVTPDIEVIPMEEVNRAYDRVVKGDVRYRFVLDVRTLL